jgi:hypothetical protein
VHNNDVKGVPSYLGKLDGSILNILKTVGLLVDANDEQIMAEQLARDSGG